ncbi:MGMT family protein [Serratia odorifera]|jgi:methylated-DNA-protein-cysteine methyltransferase related protein|nr:MGMT family protein [Serratia odorifera]MBJ2065678.1 MGMT family protein [Serratia odorifera]PNK92588.1 methyltransferase [Serratia odorifera]RII73720.1 MGMT family protein [Serratia odorifera]VDZ51805.1 Methylated-DNA--protein-cysteine methyltransferase [Serratia odorifera]HEJ9095662.1 MGMT family protein [Serratia odorifera]
MESTDATFRQRVFHVVAAIPAGKVTTYGEVAQLAGSPRAARQVGGVLKKLPPGSSLPWHRVINRHGKISLRGEDFQRQRQALLAEGIQFGIDGVVDLRRFGWRLE